MLTWNQLHQNLERAADRHLQLVARFDEFAKSVEDQVTAQTFHIQGIAATLHLDQGFFGLMFAGRTLHFVFSTIANDSGILVGNVKCYLINQLPERTHFVLGQFTFTPGGQTSLTEPEDSDPITIDDNSPSLYIALHFIHESLSR